MFPWCLVAFQKIFRKIFFGVWKRRRKTQIQKNTSHNPDRAIRRPQSEITIDGSSSGISRSSSTDLPLGSLGLHTTCRDLGSSSLAVDRDLDSARSREGEITINGAISPSRDRDQRHDLAMARSRSTATGMFVGEIAIVGLCKLSRARALSLSVKFSRNTLKGK